MTANALIGTYVFATSLGLVFLKLGSAGGPAVGFADGRPAVNLSLLSVLGIALYGFSFVLYTYLIAKFDLGYIVPLTTALVYIAVFTASYFLFDEPFTAAKLIGIALILAGLALLNDGPTTT